MTKMTSKLAILSLLLLGTAHAACPPNVACVQWNASTGWSDGKPFAAGTTLTYSVWLLGNPDRVVATTTGLSATIHGLPPGNRCFLVTVTVSPVPTGYLATSASSGSACKRLSFPGPTDGSIVGPTDGSIEQPKKP